MELVIVLLILANIAAISRFRRTVSPVPYAIYRDTGEWKKSLSSCER